MIVGITGSFGAGKGAIVDYLVSKKGFTHYSASAFITEEIIRRKLPVNRDSMIEVGNDLRANFGPAYIVETLYLHAKEAGGDAVIESLRAIAEVIKLKELGGIIIGVDAEPKIRYERSVLRGSEKDAVTYDKWLEQEKIENNPNDPTKHNIFGALKMSDYTILNNGTLEELHTQIEAFLKKFS
jgi:dephospho-CoA kinase